MSLRDREALRELYTKHLAAPCGECCVSGARDVFLLLHEIDRLDTENRSLFAAVSDALEDDPTQARMG